MHQTQDMHDRTVCICNFPAETGVLLVTNHAREMMQNANISYLF